MSISAATPDQLIRERAATVQANLARADLAADLLTLVTTPLARAGTPPCAARAAAFLARPRARWAVRAVTFVTVYLVLDALSVEHPTRLPLWVVLGVGVGVTAVVSLAALALEHLGRPLTLRTARARYLAAEACLAAEQVAMSPDAAELSGAVATYVRLVLRDCQDLDRVPGAVVPTRAVRRVATLMVTAEAAGPSAAAPR